MGVQDCEALNNSTFRDDLLQAHAPVMRRIRDGRLQDTHLMIAGDKWYPGIIIPETWTLHLTKTAAKFPYREPPAIPVVTANLDSIAQEEMKL